MDQTPTAASAPGTEGPQPAARLRRILATGIDVAILFVPASLMFTFLVGVVESYAQPSDAPDVGQGGGLLFIMFLFLLVFGYSALAHRHGASIGKALSGVKVVNSDGTPMTWSAMVGRGLAASALSLFTAGIAYVLVLRRSRRTLYDNATNSIVVRSDEGAVAGVARIVALTAIAAAPLAAIAASFLMVALWAKEVPSHPAQSDPALIASRLALSESALAGLQLSDIYTPPPSDGVQVVSAAVSDGRATAALQLHVHDTTGSAKETSREWIYARSWRWDGMLYEIARDHSSGGFEFDYPRRCTEGVYSREGAEYGMSLCVVRVGQTIVMAFDIGEPGAQRANTDFVVLVAERGVGHVLSVLNEE